MIDGWVVDATSGKPISSFQVTPGTDQQLTDAAGISVRWRDNLTKAMQGGAFKWPRTSGFSQMRFRVTAPGYHPAITHMMQRSGPYVRLCIRPKPL